MRRDRLADQASRLNIERRRQRGQQPGQSGRMTGAGGAARFLPPCHGLHGRQVWRDQAFTEVEQILGALAFRGEGRLAIEPVHRRIERRMSAAERGGARVSSGRDHRARPASRRGTASGRQAHNTL